MIMNAEMGTTWKEAAFAVLRTNSGISVDGLKLTAEITHDRDSRIRITNEECIELCKHPVSCG
jgi:hypothetical protein